ncbi:hypothetical protein ABH978_001599 [Bradyrhizobium ottawaense]
MLVITGPRQRRPALTATTIADPQSFIRANTRLRSVPLVPEIAVFLADESVPIWQQTEEELNEAGLPPRPSGPLPGRAVKRWLATCSITPLPCGTGTCSTSLLALDSSASRR